MKALVGAFNQEKALVGAFSVIVKTGCGTDGSICGTTINCPMVSTFPSTASVASSAPSMQSGQPSDTQSWGIQRPSHLHTCHMSRAVTCHVSH